MDRAVPSATHPQTPPGGGLACPECGSQALIRPTALAVGQALSRLGQAAAGLGTFVVGLLLLVLVPPVGIVVLLLALVVNAIMVFGAVATGVVGFRRRGALACTGCGHVWNPRAEGAPPAPAGASPGPPLRDPSGRLMRPGFAVAGVIVAALFVLAMFASLAGS